MFQYRRWIYAFILLVPQVFAALPFVGDRKGTGYLSQGAFCTLPIRPIWYRLALAWVPRLMIWFIILGLAIAIYVHVQREFNNFSEAFRHHSTTSTSFLSETLDGSPMSTEKRRESTPNISPHRPSSDPGSEQPPNDPTVPIEPVVERPRPTQLSHGSYMDSITECAPTNAFDSNALLPPAPTVPPEGRRNSRVRIEIPTGTAAPDTEIEANNNAQRKSISDSVRSWRSSLKQSCDNPTGRHSSLPAALSTERANTPGRNSIWTLSTFFNSSRRFSEGAKSTLSRSRAFSSGRAERRLARSTGDTMDTRMVQKRTIIRRQLRQVFVYPVVYICLWLMPFVALCVTYNTHYARRPPFVVNALNNFCLCFIGAVNAVVFSWREKPWRHIQSNPTRRFWSSFGFWRHDDDEDEEYARQQSQRRRSSANSKRWSESTYVESAAAAAAGGPPNVFSPPLPQPPPPSPQRPQPAVTTTASPLTRPSPVPLQQQQHPSIPVYYVEDDDAITPLQSPPQAFFPRKESATSSAPPRPLVPPALISRTSFPPPLHLAPDLPPSSSSPTSSVGSAGMGTTFTALARRGLKRASIMATSAAVAAAAAAAGSGEASTDAQKAARELAYERLAWERREQRQRSRQQSQRLEEQLGGRRMSRRVSTGDLAGAVGAAGGYGGGGGSLPVVAGPVPGTVGRTREWWEGGGSRGGGGASPGWCSEGEGESP